jgi:Tol biopolymer transport system component
MRGARRVAILGLVLSIGDVAPASAQNTTTRVSVATDGTQATGGSESSDISADGRYVAFSSAAATLVSGDTNGFSDVFVHDRDTGKTERVSLRSDLLEATGGDSVAPSISANGRFVAFASSATNLVANDTNGVSDIFVRDRDTSLTTRVSFALFAGQGSKRSINPVISADGRYVAFASEADNLVSGDTNNMEDIFLHDRNALTMVRVNVATGGAQSTGIFGASVSSISADGRFVAFSSPSADLVTGDSNDDTDVFVRDVVAGTTTRITVAENRSSSRGSLSADGRYVAFQSVAGAAGRGGVYLHDRQSGVTSPLSLAGVGVFESPEAPDVSDDGRHVCFSVLRPATEFRDIVVMDRQTLAKTRVSVATSGEVANSTSGSCSLNADGTIVSYPSAASNLVANDTNGRNDIFVRTVFATMALDKTALTFAATTSGGAFVSQTAEQVVQLTQSGIGTVPWAAVSSQPWLLVSPASGTGSSSLSISVAPSAGLPPGGTVTGTVAVSLTGAVNTTLAITVTLTLMPNGTSAHPFGVVDTPSDNRTGVTGAIPFTGWALDDIEVTRVSICRAAFGAEVAPVDPNCGGAAEIFVGFAVFIDGARPDVAGTFPAFPLSTRAGWGFMVLTNMLPNQGNGTYRFTARAQDREGRFVVLGARTMTCANASATLPFGTLDTPLQGETISGANFINFGWALTPLPKTIPANGSRVRVLVDGVDFGRADYNHARSDIQALFPGFNNTNGAVGFHVLDTTLLENGLHTISWAVTDDQGAIDGIGSRFFTVSNGASAVTAASAYSSARAPIDVEALPLDTSAIAGRRGWDLEAPYGWFGAGATGVTVIRSEEVSRVELQLGEGDYRGYLRTPAGLAPLPIGSRLDPVTNTFTWAPSVGFVGRYDFVFVRSADGRAVSRRAIRIVLHAKGRGAVGPQVIIDTPRAHAAVRAPFMIAGWAVDLDAPEGTGVTTLHAWAFPASGGAPIFLGATAYGGARPDVAAVHGPRFKDSGFGLIVQPLPPGDYDLALFGWSTETMSFVAPTTVPVSVRP